MNVQELANSAAKQINNKRDFLPLVMPQRKKQYDLYYLAGRKGPKGKSMGCIRGGELVHFDPVEVLAFCVVLGAKVEVVKR